MMRPSFILITIAALAACAHPATMPTDAQVQGNWRTAPYPSGSGIDLSLVSNGLLVSGSGHQYAIQYLQYTFAITGTLQDGAVNLRLTTDTLVFTFSGRVVGADTLRGEWATQGLRPEAITFFRQPN